MIKISALNDESEDESESEVEVSREALEQIALQQYAKALDLQRKGSLTEATQLLRDLLDTELLYDVKKPGPGEKVSGPLFNLKYLCYKNLASILSTSGEIEGAIEAYNSAAELDETDITLWHRLGNVSLKAKNYENALYAFQKGVELNPRHWPCLDKLIIVLLGLNYKEQCLATVHEALQLDPGYMRGLVYRRHIYTIFSHMKEYMESINPIYKWDDDHEIFDEEKSKKLLKEAEEIYEENIEQQKCESYKYVVPNLKLKKPVSRLTWQSVGESLVHMHKYITEHSFSHACFIEITSENEYEEEKMEVCEEQESDDNKAEENITDNEKVVETGSENDNDLSDKEKATDSEMVESSDVVMSELATENIQENKAQKKGARRRGCPLNYLKQWGWYERKSVRKKPTDDDKNIYEKLRNMVPLALIPENTKKGTQETKSSTEIYNIEKLFEEKAANKPYDDTVYFGKESEQNDVKSFIDKYTESPRDVIDLLKDFLSILAGKWRIKWPEALLKVFVDANKCYSTHIDIPAGTDDNKHNLLFYTSVNVLAEEIIVNEKTQLNSQEKVTHEVNVIESIEIIMTLKPHIYSSIDCLEMILRSLWLRLHTYILNNCEELALDCAYQLLSEFDAMGEHHDMFSLNIPNFTFKTDVSEFEIMEYIKILERNKKLATVMALYNRGSYEEVLSIVIESFDHHKEFAKAKEEDMPLDFSAQLSLILDAYWALDKVECCFKWSLICLHEALKHYFRLTSGSADYEKWSLTVIKILSCMEHILSTEGLSCLETISQNELGQGLEDLIRIIGHQIETNATDMPFNTVTPWIIMHYILQREEDQGRSRSLADNDKVACDIVPNPLMVLFIAHEQLGNREWCCKSDGKLLYFILDTVVPRLQSPSLAKCLEQIIQFMEQCVFCLYGHPGKKTKLKYLDDHNVTPLTLDWKRAQQIYEIFRPLDMPPLEGKLSGISAETETLFLNILSLLPVECDPSKYVPQMEKYIKGIDSRPPLVPPLLPYKMKDIYFLLGDYYFKKKNDTKLAIKFNTLDVVINNDRFKSWAQISLAKASNLERYLNSFKKINNEKDFLNPANTAIRCFRRTLELDPSYRYMWIEFGNFVYAVHSFCSRHLKQTTESMDIGEFTALEKQKEGLLELTHKCFITLRDDLNSSSDSENDESWLLYYMLGKVAEKRNDPPSVYLNFYLQGIKNLQEAGATYPSKISYNSSSLSIEVLELHYRLHASILKYIEQHENAPIPATLGKVFTHCIDEWEQSSYKRKRKKDNVTNTESENKTEETPTHVQNAANILKRSISDAGEEDNKEAKRLKLEAAAAKVRRSASYDTEHLVSKESKNLSDIQENNITDLANSVTNKDQEPSASRDSLLPTLKSIEEQTDIVEDNLPHIADKEDKKHVTSSSSSSTSSSDSNSSESSSDSSSESSKDTDASSMSSEVSKPMTDDEIKKIVIACLDALEDCASRYTPHYKALYRLAHYHFYYQKGKDIERCRDLMLSTFISRCERKKMTGLFAERKPSNFFNNIWKLGSEEVERAGAFPFHMNRCVLLTLEILKEIDDHKTLLDLSIQLQRTPDLDKKYLKDSDREELAAQALSLCVQSLKGQLQKFSQQADIKSNNVERQALKCLMLDIFKAYRRVMNHPKNANQFVNLLVDAFKLVYKAPLTENMNLVDVSLKYVTNLKLQNMNVQKKQATKLPTTTVAEPAKTVTVITAQPKADPKPTSAPTSSASGLPKMSPHEMAAAFQNYVPMLNDPVLSQLSLNYISALAGYPIQNSLQSSLQSSLQNSFQAEFYRQFMSQNFSSYMQPQKKQKRAPKQSSTSRNIPQMKNVTSKSNIGSVSTSSVTKSFTGSTSTSSVTKSYTGSINTSSVSKSFTLPISTSSVTKPYSGSTSTVVTNLYTGSTSASVTKPFTGSMSTSVTKSFAGSTSTSVTKSFAGGTNTSVAKPFTGSTSTSVTKSFAGSTSTSVTKSFAGGTNTSVAKPFTGSTSTSVTKSFAVSTNTAVAKPITGSTSTSVTKPFTGSTSTSVTKPFTGSTSTLVTKPFTGSTNTSVTKSFTGSTNTSVAKPFTGSTNTSVAKPFTGSTSTSVTKSFTGSTNTTVTKLFVGSTSASVTKSYTGSTISSVSKPYTASTSISIAKAAPTPVITSLQKSSTLAPSMGTVLSTLPASMTSNLTSFGANSSLSSGQSSAPHAHMSAASSTNTSVHPKPPMPHQQTSPGKTLQEKLAERQKSIPSAPKDINASISRLPSSLTITKTSVPKQPLLHGKRTDPKKSLAFEEVRPLPISSDEVIVLDDD